MTLNSHIQNILKNSKKDTEWKKEAEERLNARNESKKSGLIATQLAIYMAENGISQTDLGRMTGVSPQQISKVLKGRENLTLATIEKIENALGVQLVQVNILEKAELKRLELIKRKRSRGHKGGGVIAYQRIQTKNFESSYSFEITPDKQTYPFVRFENLLQKDAGFFLMADEMSLQKTGYFKLYPLHEQSATLDKVAESEENYYKI